MDEEQHWAVIADEDGMLEPGPAPEDWEAFYATRETDRSYGAVSATRYKADTDQPYGERFDSDLLEEALDLGVFGATYRAWRDHVEGAAR